MQLLFAALIAGFRRRELALARQLVKQDWARYNQLWASLLSDDPAAAAHAAAVAAEAARLVSSPVVCPRQMIRARPQPTDSDAAPIFGHTSAQRSRTARWASLLQASIGTTAETLWVRRVMRQGGLGAGVLLDVERWAEATDEALPLANLDQLFAQVRVSLWKA